MLTIFLSREARIFFKAGLNHDGYFSADNLLQQVDYAINIFEGKTKGMAQGLFLFDNAPSHQKRAANALSARKMPKSILQPLFLFSLTSAWLIIALQIPELAGHLSRMHQGCAMALTLKLESHSHCTSLMTTPPCQNGLKGWSKLYGSVVFGQRLVCLLSAQALNALMARLTAAANVSFSTSLTLFLRSHSFISSLSLVATSVISTPNITVN